MALLDQGLAYFCASVIASGGQYNTACNKAAEAGTKQVGVYKLLDDKERNTMSMATDLGKDTVGNAGMEVGGVGVFIYRFYRNRSITFKLPNIGISDSIYNKITPDSYTVNLGWKF